jgi:hypothetical protein
MSRPQCGRKLKSQCSSKALRGQPTQPEASHNDHAAWSPPSTAPDGRTSHASSLPVGLAQCNHLPRRRPSPRRPCAGSARPAPASSARLQPRTDNAPSWTSLATTPTWPSQPCGSTATPRDLIPVGHSGRRDARTPAAGHWTPERSGRPHRTPVTWTGTRGTPDTHTGHWTPHAGHERGHGVDSTAGIRTSLAATPSDCTLRPATVFVLSRTPAGCSALRRPSGAPGALLSSDDYGSRVERAAKLHPL